MSEQIARQNGPIAQQLDRELKAKFRLSALNHEMAAYLGVDPASLPNARRNLTDAQSGWLPAHQDPRSHFWMVNRSDLPRIAALWGLVPSAEAAPRALAAAAA